jgi:hypothetical protein
VDKALNDLLAKVRSDKQVPASTNDFSQKNESNKVDFQSIEAKKKEIVERNKAK